MFKKPSFLIASFIILCFLIYLLFTNDFLSYMKYEFSSKNNLKVNFYTVNPEVRAITADPSNKLVLRVEVRDPSGSAVPMAHVALSASDSIGKILPSDARTDGSGECLVTYIPPDYTADNFKNGDVPLILNANLVGTNIKSSVNLAITKVPVILIHGYKEYPEIFDNLKEYLSSRNIESSAIKYDSGKGVVSGSKDLSAFLQQQKKIYGDKGIQLKSFDVVAHSLGGLIARYYSCSDDYIKNNDIRKLIFVAVPQRGSPWASMGKNYYNDQGINDLVPESQFMTVVLPAMFNKGLNNNIQVGSIIGQYDEVVSPESASLDEWNIKTEIFSVGENNFTMDNLVSGKIIEAANHKIILSNRKVFERIETMLGYKLPYPSLRK